MNDSVFLDSSFLIALVRKNDEHHATALKWNLLLRGPFITTEYVLVEFLDSASSTILRGPAMNTVRLLRNRTTVQIVPTSSKLLDDGLAEFERSADKEWGLTDCISFVLMRQHGIQRALTGDRHFEQAGFRALLRQAPDQP